MRRVVTLAFVCSLLSCDGDNPADPVCVHDPANAPVEIVDEVSGRLDEPSVAALDRPTSTAAIGDATLPVEAKILVIAGTGSESELAAIRSILDHRGVPYDLFIANAEPALDAADLRDGNHGFYQATILTSASVGGTLSSSEWAALADYEHDFAIRRAVLTATPDPAMGWGSYTTTNTSTTALSVTCTSAGAAVFRDVRCDLTQKINGDTAYLSAPASSALTPLLRTSSGHALAAIHTASDGRESLLLLFRQNSTRVHSQQFLHGVLGWVTGGTYLGERRIDMGIQVDDLFLATDLYTGGRYRMNDVDMRAALAWAERRRETSITPDFRVLWAFNGLRATDGDPLTEEVKLQDNEWWWVTHTFSHHHLDAADYSLAYSELSQNIATAADVPLVPFDSESFVPPNISGLVNPEVQQAVVDVGIRYVVSDTSKPGCDNPSPNMAFYNALQPSVLIIPRRPTNLGYHVSTPSEWMEYYNDQFADHWGRDSSYSQILNQESDVLLRYLLRGEADPWMFHQANTRAYDGVHSLLGDLIDTAMDKLGKLLRVPVRTPAMHENGERFARRINFEGAGVRATLYRGRALVIDAGRDVTIPVTGARTGESYGGDVIAMVDVDAGTQACIPLDAAGQGCIDPPDRPGGAGTVTPLPRDYCDGTGKAGLPPSVTDTAIARASTWKYWASGDLGTSWRARSFADSGWPSGAGPLGFGESYIRTALPSGRVTYYFRKSFTVDDTSNIIGLRGELMYDDGAVIYLNGTEIARAAMPTGTISASTLSTGHEAANSYSLLNWDAAADLLVEGTNVIAVEVHQQAASSSDLVFDLGLVLELSAETDPEPEPPPILDGGVPRDSAWWYHDAGTDLGTAWRTSAGGSGWESGDGPLGYGESYIDTTITVSNRITTYFTTQFTVDDADAVTSMIGEVMYDDGFVAYLNGVEIGRAAMPTGTVTASTLSTGHEAGNAFVAFDWTAGLSALRDGLNTIAVEVHQAGTSSSDLVFDLGLTLDSDTPPPPPPDGGVPRSSAWWYWDAGGSLGTAWRTQEMGGTGWELGEGPLGYGESYLRTTVTESARITTYFTATFTVDDASAVGSMLGEVMYDDGFVAYLNGVEIGRAAMPTGAVSSTTASTGHEANNAYVTFDWSAGLGALRTGTNVIAVEVHQASTSSSDLVFDLALVLGTGGDPPPPPPAAEDIARGSTWRYWDATAAPASGWNQPSFSDASWASGAGPLGYGESYVATTLSYGGDASNKTITAYFRGWFTVESPSLATRLLGEVLYDDGAVVYLNGNEIARLSMPTGTITPTTLASPHETGRYEDLDWSAWSKFLVDGPNLIAVEVHQDNDSSSDLTFDLSLDVTP